MNTIDTPALIDPDGFERLPAGIRCVQPLYPWTTLTAHDVELACRDALRAQLQRSRRPGLDYELLTCGLRYALAILNRGLTRFQAFATAIVENLGEPAIPYLRSWYAAKWDPRFDGGVVDSETDVDAFCDNAGLAKFEVALRHGHP